MKAETLTPAGGRATNSPTKTRNQQPTVHANQRHHGHGGGSTGPKGGAGAAAARHTTAAVRAACGVTQRTTPAARTASAGSVPRALTKALCAGRVRCSVASVPS